MKLARLMSSQLGRVVFLVISFFQLSPNISVAHKDLSLLSLAANPVGEVSLDPPNVIILVKIFHR